MTLEQDRLDFNLALSLTSMRNLASLEKPLCASANSSVKWGQKYIIMLMWMFHEVIHVKDGKTARNIMISIDNEHN